MILDNSLFFSDGQAVTTATTNAATDDVDLLAAGDSLDCPLWLVITAKTAAASAGAATVQYQLQTSADANTWTTLWTGPAVAYTSVVAGYQTRLKLPVGCLRYLRVNYIVGTAALTGGTFTAVLSKTIDKTHAPAV